MRKKQESKADDSMTFLNCIHNLIDLGYTVILKPDDTLTAIPKNIPWPQLKTELGLE